MRHAAIALVLTVAVPARADGWTDDYRRALEALERGRLEAAREALERAVEAHPTPEPAARAYGTRSLGYFPWLQLSVVAYREGRLDDAERFLARSLELGVVESTDEGRTLVAKQRLLLENLRLLRSAEAEGLPGAPVHQRTERDLLREKLLARKVAAACGEPPPERQASRPWYYHYLIARELAAHGDHLGAIGRLAQALARRDEPSESARTYGMKVIAYRPYFDLGKAHARIENWSCAVDALSLSEQLEELGEGDEQARRERSELLAGARLRLAP